METIEWFIILLFTLVLRHTTAVNRDDIESIDVEYSGNCHLYAGSHKKIGDEKVILFYGRTRVDYPPQWISCTLGVEAKDRSRRIRIELQTFEIECGTQLKIYNQYVHINNPQYSLDCQETQRVFFTETNQAMIRLERKSVQSSLEFELKITTDQSPWINEDVTELGLASPSRDTIEEGPLAAIIVCSLLVFFVILGVAILIWHKKCRNRSEFHDNRTRKW